MARHRQQWRQAGRNAGLYRRDRHPERDRRGCERLPRVSSRIQVATVPASSRRREDRRHASALAADSRRRCAVYRPDDATGDAPNRSLTQRTTRMARTAGRLPGRPVLRDDRPRWPVGRPGADRRSLGVIAPTAASPCSHAGDQLRVSWPSDHGAGHLELDLRPGQPLIRTMGFAGKTGEAATRSDRKRRPGHFPAGRQPPGPGGPTARDERLQRLLRHAGHAAVSDVSQPARPETRSRRQPRPAARRFPSARSRSGHSRASFG